MVMIRRVMVPMVVVPMAMGVVPRSMVRLGHRSAGPMCRSLGHGRKRQRQKHQHRRHPLPDTPDHPDPRNRTDPRPAPLRR